MGGGPNFSEGVHILQLNKFRGSLFIEKIVSRGLSDYICHVKLKLGKTALFGTESLEEGTGTLFNLNNFKVNGNSESRDPTEATSYICTITGVCCFYAGKYTYRQWHEA